MLSACFHVHAALFGACLCGRGCDYGVKLTAVQEIDARIALQMLLENSSYGSVRTIYSQWFAAVLAEPCQLQT